MKEVLRQIIVNGTEDHVHCFFALKPAASVSGLMKAVKAKLSKYVNDHHLTPHRFEWQVGFGVFSYRQRDVDTIYRYIQNQEEHHKAARSFNDEYLESLMEFHIQFDNRYIFDDPVWIFRLER